MAHVLENRTLEHFRAAVSETYGDRLVRIVLFGSRARGDARSDSDYDVAVFLRDLGDLADPRELAARDAEMKRLANLSTAILYESGEFIHAMPYPTRSYNDRTPLMHEIRAEGIDL
jgi:predicted nucleotidyltransferase